MGSAMRFEWDESKNLTNRRSHGVSFEIAQEVFADPFCITIRDRIVGGEERFWSIGRLENLNILVVVHLTFESEGREITRIISARKATRRERKFYEEIDQ